MTSASLGATKGLILVTPEGVDLLIWRCPFYGGSPRPIEQAESGTMVRGGKENCVTPAIWFLQNLGEYRSFQHPA